MPAALAVGLVSLTFALGSSGSKPAALTCPASVRTSTDRPWVPSVTDAVDTENRLAPDRLPTDVIVCAYAGSGKGPQPARKPLTGDKHVNGGIDEVVDTVGYLPRKIASQEHCPAPLRNEDDGYFLLGLAYVDGTEWIATSANLCSPTPTTNGSFDSSAPLWIDLRQAYRSGSWPAPDPSVPCASRGQGRSGQEESLVPVGYTSVELCKTVGERQDQVRHPGRAESDGVVAALDRLATAPMTTAGGCFGWYASGADDVEYRLVFHYPVGADVVVVVATSKDCDPPIGNGSLQSTDVSGVLPLLERMTS